MLFSKLLFDIVTFSLGGWGGGESYRISLVDHADGFKTLNTFPNESDGWRHVSGICVGNDCKWSWEAGLGLMLTSCVVKTGSN